MNARRFMLLATLATTALATTSARALEKHPRALVDDDHSAWRVGSSCSLIYYNTCTGWIWVWSGWLPNDRLGVQYVACCPNAELHTSFAYAVSGAPAGYGFTGTMSVYPANASQCPTGSPLASKPWLPQAGWNLHTWNVPVPTSFVVMTTLGAGDASPIAFGTDHPAAGPTGGQACGTCYPSTRPNHSFWWGTPTSPFCPGSPFNDGVCDAQLLWDAQMSCPVAIEPSTWGGLKALYR